MRILKGYRKEKSMRIIFALNILLLNTGCFSEYDTSGPPDPKHFMEVINTVVSPKKKRAAKIIEAGNSNGSNTQITVEFGWPDSYGGSGVFAAKGINLGIELQWLDDDNLVISYKSGLKVLPGANDKQAILFNEKVNIQHKILHK